MLSRSMSTVAVRGMELPKKATSRVTQNEPKSRHPFDADTCNSFESRVTFLGGQLLSRLLPPGSVRFNRLLKDIKR